MTELARQKAITVLKSYINRYTEEANDNDTYIWVKGRNENLPVPIFTYYNYRIVIDDYLKLLEERNE